ncbi:hypothetical protein [Bacillus sp. H1m]|uniref:hypothetical protein n=1 Tax=Bacillus sp. H1m TaxID=1397277 RepID=UPI001965175B|nr:hypothetical protein [Bacillus sp. H1m]
MLTEENRDKMLKHITVPFHDNFVSNGVFTIVRYSSRYFLISAYHCVVGYEDGEFLSSLNFLMENTGGKKWITPKVEAMYYNKKESIDLVAFDVDSSFLEKYIQKEAIDVLESAENVTKRKDEHAFLQSFSQEDGREISFASDGVLILKLNTTAIGGKINYEDHSNIIIKVPEGPEYRGFSGSAVYVKSDNDDLIFIGLARQWNRYTSEIHVTALHTVVKFLEACLKQDPHSYFRKLSGATIPTKEIDLD